jgi:glycogen debranching enzyme
MRRALLSELHDGEGFFAHGVTDRAPHRGRSLLLLMPAVASTRLPGDIRAQLERDVRRHLTEWGLATELPGTPEYQDDGYWRGPIWAPSTLLIEDGLRRAGCTDLADEISLRFRRLCEHSGFAENFDARTGAGLRDRAYTWTASVYLVLCRDAALRAA